MIPLDTSLNPKQIAILDFPYNEDAFGSKAKRFKDYVTDHPQKACGVLFPESSVIGNITTYLDVSCTSVIASSPVSLICPVNALTTICISTLSLLAVFESLVIVENIAQIKNSPGYKAWKNLHTQTMSDNKITDFLKEDDLLLHFLCPITKKIPKIPAKTADSNITYDYSAACQWINTGKPLPGLNKVITINELLFDYAHINTILLRLKELKSLLENEEKRRISVILGVRDLNNNKINEFYYMMRTVAFHANTTIAELCTGKGMGCKSLKRLNLVCAKIDLSSSSQRKLRTSKFSNDLREIRNSPFKALYERREAMRLEDDLILKSSKIKEVKLGKPSFFSAIINHVFGYKVKVEFNYASNSKANSIEWGINEVGCARAFVENHEPPVETPSLLILKELLNPLCIEYAGGKCSRQSIRVFYDQLTKRANQLIKSDKKIELILTFILDRKTIQNLLINCVVSETNTPNGKKSEFLSKPQIADLTANLFGSEYLYFISNEAPIDNLDSLGQIIDFISDADKFKQEEVIQVISNLLTRMTWWAASDQTRFSFAEITSKIAFIEKQFKGGTYITRELLQSDVLAPDEVDPEEEDSIHFNGPENKQEDYLEYHQPIVGLLKKNVPENKQGAYLQYHKYIVELLKKHAALCRLREFNPPSFDAELFYEMLVETNLFLGMIDPTHFLFSPCQENFQKIIGRYSNQAGVTHMFEINKIKEPLNELSQKLGFGSDSLKIDPDVGGDLALAIKLQAEWN